MCKTVNKYDVAIIGGGAAGLSAAAAINNVCDTARIIILEKEQRVGKRILASGNGRCNITNMNISLDNYRCSEDISGFLEHYTPEKLMDIFSEFGIMCRIDSCGRVYPYSEQASSVLDMLRYSCSKYESCSSKAVSLSKKKNEFIIDMNNGNFVTAKFVLLASGGCVQQNLGADGSGYALAEKLGHSIKDVYPALGPVPVKSKILPSLKGVRCSCSVSLVIDGKTVKTEHGEIQFNDNALSGICVFQLSPYINEFLYYKKKNEMYISVSLMPDKSYAEIYEIIEERVSRLKDLSCESFFNGIFNKRIGMALFKECGVSLSSSAGGLNKAAIKSISAKINDWRFYPSGITDKTKAQITRGGVNAKEIDFSTMESKLVNNLFLAGEVIDIDGDCGGYNLHFAFSSGHCAGTEIAKRICNND